MQPLQCDAQDSLEDVDFLDLYGTDIYKFCFSLTYCAADAEDLFQDTFLAVFEQQRKGKVFADLKKRLFSTALFLWKSRKRKYARRQRIAPTQPLYDTIAAAESFEEDMETSEQGQLVRRTVAALPSKFSIPITLYYASDIPISEIAEIMGIAEGTVKSRLHKAKKLIAKELEGKL